MDTTEQDAAPEVDSEQDQDSGRPAQTVRVPNVSPGAKSGLDHIVIGANALDSSEDEADPDAPPADDDDPDAMPTGDQAAALAWVQAAEDADTAKTRADQVWAGYGDGDDASDLATALRAAVYGSRDPKPVTVPDGLEGDELDAWVSGDAVEGDEQDNPDRWAAYLARREAAGLGPLVAVQGELVESDTAGTGDAINDATGEVTPAGEQLPTIEQDGGQAIESPAAEDAASGGDAEGSGPEPSEGAPSSDQSDQGPDSTS